MNQSPPVSPDEADDDRPPVLGSWTQIYVIVLLLHFLLIGLFYWFTKAFS